MIYLLKTYRSKAGKRLSKAGKQLSKAGKYSNLDTTQGQLLQKTNGFYLKSQFTPPINPF